MEGRQQTERKRTKQTFSSLKLLKREIERGRVGGIKMKVGGEKAE